MMSNTLFNLIQNPDTLNKCMMIFRIKHMLGGDEPNMEGMLQKVLDEYECTCICNNSVSCTEKPLHNMAHSPGWLLALKLSPVFQNVFDFLMLSNMLCKYTHELSTDTVVCALHRGQHESIPILTKKKKDGFLC